MTWWSYTRDDSETRDIATIYYHKLLSAKSFSEEDISKRQLVLETVRQKVTHVMASQLPQPCINIEVWTTTKSLGKYVSWKGCHRSSLLFALLGLVRAYSY